MHISARTSRAGIHVAALVIPVAYLVANARLAGVARFIGIITVLLVAALVAAAFVSMAIDLGGHIRDRQHLAAAMYGRVSKVPLSVRCGVCGRSIVRVGDLYVCPTCDRTD